MSGPPASPLLGAGPFAVDLDGGPGAATVGYGKAYVTTYRAGAPALAVASVPGSGFTGRPPGLAAAELTVEVAGPAFLDAYTSGDNTRVVATDSMKNLVLVVAAEAGCATVEGLAAAVAARVLAEWADVATVRVSGRELPYAAQPLAGGGVSGQSWRRLGGAHQVASVTVDRAAGTIELLGGIDELELVRLSGSSFAGFVRDRFTTLAETEDRPLPVGVRARWWYADPGAAGAAGDPAGYVAREQVTDLLGLLLHELASRSIQELVLTWARRLLAAYPAIGRVWLEAENRTWAAPPVAPALGSPRAWTVPQPMFGLIRLDLARDGGGEP